MNRAQTLISQCEDLARVKKDYEIEDIETRFSDALEMDVHTFLLSIPHASVAGRDGEDLVLHCEIYANEILADTKLGDHNFIRAIDFQGKDYAVKQDIRSKVRLYLSKCPRFGSDLAKRLLAAK